MASSNDAITSPRREGEVDRESARANEHQSSDEEAKAGRQELFDSLFSLFKKSIQKKWNREALFQHALAVRLVRLVKATFEQRSLYPETWRTQFVRRARTLHSVTGFRDIRALLFEWLKQMGEITAAADLFIYMEPAIRRHYARLSRARLLTFPEPDQTTDGPPHPDSLVLTVDNPETTDRDDALSLRHTDSGYEIGVHTPLLEDHLPAGSELDVWAYEMSVSAYLPHLTIPMLPNEFAVRLASLDAGAVRPVVSFYFGQNHDGTIGFNRACCETITVTRNCHYEEIERELAWILRNDEPESDSVPPVENEVETAENEMWIADGGGVSEEWRQALRIWRRGSEQLEKQRLESGGRAFDREQIDVLVNEDGRVQLRRFSQSSPARKMISEWMIAANQAAGRFCASNHLPCVYRVQEPASELAEEGGPEPGRNFVRSQISLEPARHHDLGIDGYAHVTSPLRRFLDLLNQRQLVSLMRTGNSYYTPDELWQRALKVEAASRRVQKVEAKAAFYYKCVYLAQHLGKRLKADICYGPRPSRSIVLYLHELGLRLFVPSSCIKGIRLRQIPPNDKPRKVIARCQEIDPYPATMLFHVELADRPG